MRIVDVSLITRCVKELCIKANTVLPADLVQRIEYAKRCETQPLAKSVLGDLLLNLEAATDLGVPICQDTGMAVVFIKLGQDVHLVGGSLNAAVDKGVAQGYQEGKLRCSVVLDPILRGNTGDNTPAILHLSMIDGEAIEITVAPKGFGSENMSAIRMFNPTATAFDIVNFVCETVRKGGANPCPPIVVGVGIGGDFELAAILSKQALCLPVSNRNADKFYADLEDKMLVEINKLGVGVQGFGGETTALAVNILTYPTHIAGLPVAVNIGCHVTRHQSGLV